MRDYAELLLDPRWQRRRLEVFDRDGWACLRCKNKLVTLHAHHEYCDDALNFYPLYLNPWEYPLETIKTLCDDCHRERHEIRNIAKEMTAKVEVFKMQPWLWERYKNQQ